ncbi:MAG: prolyl-tRNA synthetase associated domain-containing protein [Alphaproteobacteria bacterium]|nr:prolyl-tRNA synthetase associated domain-containing protein [Alphaproteobacteria bacterium]
MSDQAPLPTSPDKLFEILEALGIAYRLHEHEAVFTVAESSKLDEEIEGTPCRNLYLRDKKKQNFLVVAANETPVDLKALQDKLGCGRLSFGSAERLWEYLGIRPGSVCPFTVINDPQHHVQVVLDAHMMAQESVCYHPLDNRMTIALSPSDLLKFFAHTGHVPQVLAF